MRILLIDINVILRDKISHLLGKYNFSIDAVDEWGDVKYVLSIFDYCLAVINTDIPKASPIDILKDIRQSGNNIPIIAVGQKMQPNVLDAGADDYVVNPFDAEELKARVRALLRRANSTASADIVMGDLSFNQNARDFYLKGKLLVLPARERSVLERLIVKAGHTVSKAQLYNSVFGFNEDVGEKAIELYVHRLRKRILGSDVYISTVRGHGYSLQRIGAASGDQ